MISEIPKKLHAVWFGPLEEGILSYWQQWQALHPGWECKLWTEEEVAKLDLIGWLPFRYMRDLGQLSDLARYEILRLHGGFYVDLDVEPYRPIDDLCTTGARLVYADHKPGNPSNFFLGAVPGHPAMVAACREIVKAFPFRLHGRPWSRKLDHRFGTTIVNTGPDLWRDVTTRFFGLHQPTRGTEPGLFIGRPGTHHATLAVWPGFIPHGRDAGHARAFARHHTWNSWHKAREQSDEEAIYWETIFDTYGLHGLDMPEYPYILDCGAHRGLFGVSCLKLWPRARIESFEPNLALWETLKDTRNRMWAHDRWHVRRAAVAAVDGEMGFLVSRKTGRSSLLAGVEGVYDEIRVPAVTLSRWVRLHAEVDLLKLDIEGAEYQALSALHAENLLGNIRHIRMETHPHLVPGITEACLALLEPTHELVHAEMGSANDLLWLDQRA